VARASSSLWGVLGGAYQKIVINPIEASTHFFQNVLKEKSITLANAA